MERKSGLVRAGAAPLYAVMPTLRRLHERSVPGRKLEFEDDGPFERSRGGDELLDSRERELVLASRD